MEQAPSSSRPAGEAALFASATLFAFVDIAVKFAARSFSSYLISAVRFAGGVLLGVAG